MGRIAVWTIVGIYLVYALIFFGGRDGESDYFWVNNDFFAVPLLILAFVVTMALVASTTAEYLRTERSARRLRTFGAAGLCLLLTLLFIPYAYFLAFSGY